MIMEKILVTGVGGFIGRRLARYFSKQKYTVYGLDRLHSENAPLTDLAEYVQVELPSPRFGDLLQRWQPDAILHCAGRASVPGAMEDPASDFIDGPNLTFSLLASIRDKWPATAFVLLSSAAVYGDPEVIPVNENAPVRPISAYGFHKWQSEIICREYAALWGIRTSSVRIFSAYGPGLRRQVMWDITYKALTRPEIKLQGTGFESRDFIHVQDIAQGLSLILKSASMQGEVYNLASGYETKIADLATLITAQLNTKSKIIFSGVLPAGTPKNWRADIGKISVLGFSHQVPLEMGVREFVEWARREIQGV
jgi:UDP-glucose 4-epimerase